jgi:hypothetical protein
MNRRIYRLSEEDYYSFASEIEKRLNTPCYFSGNIEIESASGEALRLTASLILYRRGYPGTRFGPICDVSQVWWDFQCEDEEGVICDDFDFDKLRAALIEEE